MHRRRRMFEPPSDPGGTTDDWLITWGDAISLLLGFFVLLFSVSEIDTDRFAQVAEAPASRSEIDEEVPEVVAEVLTGREIVDRVQGHAAAHDGRGLGGHRQLPAGARVSFDADALFDGPGTTLRPEVEPLLTTLAWELRQRDMQHYIIEVQAAPSWMSQVRGRCFSHASWMSRAWEPSDCGPRLRGRGPPDAAPAGRQHGQGEGGRIAVLIERP